MIVDVTRVTYTEGGAEVETEYRWEPCTEPGASRPVRRAGGRTVVREERPAQAEILWEGAELKRQATGRGGSEYYLLLYTGPPSYHAFDLNDAIGKGAARIV